jgi:hypothetical protein
MTSRVDAEQLKDDDNQHEGLPTRDVGEIVVPHAFHVVDRLVRHNAALRPQFDRGCSRPRHVVCPNAAAVCRPQAFPLSLNYKTRKAILSRPSAVLRQPIRRRAFAARSIRNTGNIVEPNHAALCDPFQPEGCVEDITPPLVSSDGLACGDRIHRSVFHLPFQSADHRIVVRDRDLQQFELCLTGHGVIPAEQLSPSAVMIARYGHSTS